MLDHGKSLQDEAAATAIARALDFSNLDEARLRGAEAGESEEDYASRLAANLEQLILREGPDTVAAFIAEPLMGVGGVLLPPRTYGLTLQYNF